MIICMNMMVYIWRSERNKIRIFNDGNREISYKFVRIYEVISVTMIE